MLNNKTINVNKKYKTNDKHKIKLNQIIFIKQLLNISSKNYFLPYIKMIFVYILK